MARTHSSERRAAVKTRPAVTAVSPTIAIPETRHVATPRAVRLTANVWTAVTSTAATEGLPGMSGLGVNPA